MSSSLKIIALLLPLFFALSCASTSEKKPDEVKIHYSLGLSYYNEGNRVGALKELLHTEVLAPRNKEVQNALGLVYFSLDRYDDSIIHFNKAIKIDKDYSAAYNNLGTVYLDREDYDKAIAIFEKATSNVLYGTPEMSYNNIGWAYYKKGDFRKALANYRTSLKFAPQFLLPSYNIATIYYEKKMYKEAAIELKKVLRQSPDSAEARFKLGLAYLQLKKNKKALKAFKKCLEGEISEKIKGDAEHYIKLLK